MSGPVTKKQILQAAKRRIKSGKEEFICLAIQFGKHGESWQKNELTRWIEEMLDGSGTYASWLRKHHPELINDWDDATVGRLQWLDWMIEQVGVTS